MGFEEVYELALLEEDESDDVEHILLGRSVDDEGEGLMGEGIFVSSDGELGAWNRIDGVERLVDEPLSGLFEED